MVALQGFEDVGAGGDDDVGDQRAARNAAETVNDDGGAGEFEELFGSVGAHAGAEAGGGEDGGYPWHGIW